MYIHTSQKFINIHIHTHTRSYIHTHTPTKKNQQVASEDKRLHRNVLEQRRFILVEGLYKNFGDLCPLPDIVALKKKYCYRLYLDQTFSFGCFGATGRGITEQFNIPLEEVDIMSVSISHALGSVGGMCVGTSEVVDHQRLSGAGYCFSASAPPFTSSAAIAALHILEKEPKLVEKLQGNARFLSKGLQKIAGLVVTSDEISPVIHVSLDGGKYGWDVSMYMLLWMLCVYVCMCVFICAVVYTHT
jgi:serine palmitoyltransferase